MKSIDQLIAEYKEATGHDMDGTARGCLWDAWQGGKREERGAVAAIVERMMYLPGPSKTMKILKAISQRTADEDVAAMEEEDRLTSTDVADI